MGAFHEGHLSLMRKAKSECDLVITSLFVNPTQFAPSEDFASYPRNLDRDSAMAAAAGVDVLFAPSQDEMYPRTTTKVTPSGVATRWEGERRPGHFEGVATIVLKLFNIVQPQQAYFGLKDFQQCAVIRQMVEDLNLPITLRFEETVREPDGLAMSSRNAYLSADQRTRAPLLYQTLSELSTAIARSDRSQVEAQLPNALQGLESAGFRVDYLDVVDEWTLEPSAPSHGPCRILAAAFLGTTRLIDNVSA
jgi:pantoate--beta-alanine ligase